MSAQTRIPVALALGCLLSISVASADEDPQDLFKSLDANNDGVLASDEMGESQSRPFHRLLRLGDGNADGKLTKAEYLSALQKGDQDASPAESRQDPPRASGGNFGESLQMFNKSDRNGDGKVELGELPEEAQRRLAPLFERSGKTALTKEDFERLRERMGQFPRSPEGAAPPRQPGAGREQDRPIGQPPLLRLLDTDRNGRLTQAEFKLAAEKFAELDRNNDGSLDLSELVGPMLGRSDMLGRFQEGSMQRRPAESGAQSSDAFFERLDKDGDGVIAETEAPEFIKPRFGRLDTNSDDRLTREELRGLWDQRRRGEPNKRPDQE